MRFLVIRCRNEATVQALIDRLLPQLRKDDYEVVRLAGADHYYALEDLAGDSTQAAVLDLDPDRGDGLEE